MLSFFFFRLHPGPFWYPIIKISTHTYEPLRKWFTPRKKYGEVKSFDGPVEDGFLILYLISLSPNRNSRRVQTDFRLIIWLNRSIHDNLIRVMRFNMENFSIIPQWKYQLRDFYLKIALSFRIRWMRTIDLFWRKKNLNDGNFIS